jgi:CBS domain-containing protein
MATRMANTVTSTVEELGSTLARQAEAASERLQMLAGALRESMPTNGSAVVSEGLASAKRYLDERELGDLGRQLIAVVRRHPVPALLAGVGFGYFLTRLVRRSTSAASSATRLGDVMTRHVEVVRPDTALQEAAAKMADLDVGTMPVCDGERLVGLLTDRDITVRAIARGAGPTTPVRDIMTSTVRYGFEDEPVERALETMKKRKIRRLPVLDRDRRLTGIVSLGDLAVDTDSAEAGEALERISQPARPAR